MEITNFVLEYKLQKPISEINAAIKQLGIGKRVKTKILLTSKETELLLKFIFPVKEYISKDRKFLIINSRLNYKEYELIR